MFLTVDDEGWIFYLEMELKNDSTTVHSVDETQSPSSKPTTDLKPSTDPTLGSPITDPSTSHFTKSPPEKKKSPFSVRIKDPTINEKSKEESKSNQEEESSTDDNNDDGVYSMMKAVGDFFEEVEHDIADQYRGLPESFQLSQSRGLFSINRKGIMIIKVKVSYLEEGAAIQID